MQFNIKENIMKKLKSLSIIACLVMLVFAANANNIQVGEVITLSDHNVEEGYMLVRFDVSWENSWRLSSGPSNHDAAWIFIKYRETGGEWQHAWLHNEGHTAPAGSAIDVGLLHVDQEYHETNNPAMGVFVYRSEDGGGDFVLEDVKLRWNYALNGVADDAVLDVRVFAIEMVYIPEEPFYLGSGGGPNPELYKFYKKAPQHAIDASQNDNIVDRAFDNNTSTYWHATVAGTWLSVDLGPGNGRPMNGFRWNLGWNSHYAPRNFLVQGSHDAISWVTVHTQINATNSTGWHHYDFVSPEAFRHYRWVIQSTWSSYLPRIRHIDYDFAPYLVESEDEIPVGFEHPEGLYYIAHSNAGDANGPIPAEYPKGYRSFYIMKYPVSQKQYVDFLNTITRQQQQVLYPAMVLWRYMGNHTSNIVTNRNGVRLVDLTADPLPRVFANHLTASGDQNKDNDGQWIACNFMDYIWAAAFTDWAGLRPYTELEYEKASRGPRDPEPGEYAWGTLDIERATGVVNSGQANELGSPAGANANYLSSVGGPLRVGNFAREGTNRVQAGASWYGVMDMSGNVLEIVVTAGNVQGRSFTGNHGNGNLSLTGYSDIPGWPGFNASTETITGRAGMGLRGGAWNSADTFLRLSDRQWAALQRASVTDVGFRAARTVPVDSP